MSVIVVGMDNSERAPRVWQEALRWAREGDELLVVRGVGDVELPEEVLPLTKEDLLGRLLRSHQAQLEALAGGAPEGVSVRVEARAGAPWKVLCHAAERSNAKLVVVGTHGHSVLERALGTTASRVVEHAPCSVVAVRC